MSPCTRIGSATRSRGGSEVDGTARIERRSPAEEHAFRDSLGAGSRNRSRRVSLSVVNSTALGDSQNLKSLWRILGLSLGNLVGLHDTHPIHVLGEQTSTKTARFPPSIDRWNTPETFSFCASNRPNCVAGHRTS